MNEKWVIDKIHEAGEGGNLVKIDPESAEPHFWIGVTSNSPAEWGNIIGDIQNQADLMEALLRKIELAAGSPGLKFGSDDGGVFVDIMEESA